MGNLWQRISYLGIAGEADSYDEKSSIILNQLGILLLPLLGAMGSVLFFVFHVKIVGIGLWFNGLVVLACLWLNSRGKHHISKILFCTLPALTFLLGSPLAKYYGTSRTVIFYIVPRIGLASFCMLPLFLFGFRRDWRLLLGMVMPLVCFVSFDYVHILFGINWHTFPMRYEEYPAVLFSTSTLILFSSAGILFLQKINADYEARISMQAKELGIEKEKSEQLLRNILPDEVAEELKTTGHATPRYYEMVTVLFTDFKGFTQISEQLPPQQVIEALNACFLAFDEICERHNLEKIKTIGDSYMCAGGVPLPNRSNPIDAVAAALDMQAWMENWIAQKRAAGEPIWEARIGIHSGEAVAGVIGKNKFAYDLWGDTVNLASRMESSGEAGKVNISGATYALVKEHFVCTFRGKVQAKNKGEVDMYFVESRKA